MKKILDYLRNYEPARLAAIKTAALGLLTTIGLSVSPAWDAKAGVAVATATAALTVIQMFFTRGAVYSPATVDELVKAASSGQDGPGAADLFEPRPGGPTASIDYDDAAAGDPEGS